jgi:hypothetical protein
MHVSVGFISVRTAKGLTALVGAFLVAALLGGVAPKFGEVLFERSIKPFALDIIAGSRPLHRTPTFEERWNGEK